MYKNFRVGGGIVLGLSALVLGLVGCSTTILRDSDNNIKKAGNFSVGNFNYTLCTDVKEINTTDTYIFSATYNGSEYFATSVSSKYISANTWSDKNSSLSNLSRFNFESGSTDGQYKINGNGQYIGYSGDSTSLNCQSDSSGNYFLWTISEYNTTDTFKILNVGTKTRFLGFNNNPTTSKFLAYSTQNLGKNPTINIYKVTSAQKAYTVTFETNGGSTVSSQSVDTTAEIDLNAAMTTKQHANFKGWYLDAEFNTPFDAKTYVIQSDITLYAKWAATYKVTFYNEGSQFGKYQIIEEDSKVSEPAEKPTKPSTDIYNYTFKHWSLEDGGAAFDFNTPITSNTNLYAVYEESFQDISETVASLESNSDITFDYLYNSNDFVKFTDTVPNGMTGSGSVDVNTEIGKCTYSYSLSSKTYSGTQSTRMDSNGHYIKYSFNEVVNDVVLSFSVQFNGNNTGGKLTISCLDIDGNPIKNGSKIESFDGAKHANVSNLLVDFNGISGIKSINLEYTKSNGNIGVSPIEISAKRGSKTFKSFSNFKLNLGYTFNLAEDPRVVSTGILLTGKEGFTLASNKSASLPEESYVAKFENKLKTEDYYIAVKFTNDEVKANYTRSIYVIPYVKTSTEYVYGTTYTTSIEKEVAKIDEEGIRDMFAAYVA